MKNKALNVFITFILGSLASCGQDQKVATDNVAIANENNAPQKVQPHPYGGWYCPDNLNGFPAVDIANWESVPVVNDRMPTQEETRNGTSLIFVDSEKYPDAKPLDITMPKLARFYNESTLREELVIVIQAIYVDNDSIVGFRYLNGGNGSSRLKEVKFLTESEIDEIPDSRFVTHSLQIKANEGEIWEVITNPEYAAALQPVFDSNNKLKADWRTATNVNFNYSQSGDSTALYAYKIWGSFYVQNDFRYNHYTEKFLLLENKQTGITELRIVCGPFADDFETQQAILMQWGQQVKALSEKQK